MCAIQVISLETRRDFFMHGKQFISAEHILVRFGERKILDFDRFYVYEGEKIGIVGRNGAGKTTLLRLLSGELEPDKGKLMLACEPFFFRQFSEEISRSELDGKEVSDMGVKDKVWQEQVSGGERTRLRLAELFGSRRPVAFLDEPTSNLDIKGIRKLREKIKEIDTLLLISHDRALLNAVCTRIVEICDGELKSYQGNYDDYVLLKEQEKCRQWTEYENYTNEKKRLEKVYSAKKEKARSIERRPKSISASDAKTRNFIGNRKIEDKARSMENSAKNIKKRIEHMEVKEKPRELPNIRPDFRLTNPPENRVVIRGEHIEFFYESGAEIFKDASFEIANGSHVAVVGENGAGKTTLLHLIRDRRQVYVVPRAKIGIFEQNLETLDYTKTVLQNVMEVSIQKEEIARIILARLLFTREDMMKRAEVLSGGERIKLAFAKIFVSDANLLVLDEPTNYLDIPSVEALEKLFVEYEGTLVFVSHDEAFIRKVATEVLTVKDGKVTKHLNRLA